MFYRFFWLLLAVTPPLLAAQAAPRAPAWSERVDFPALAELRRDADQLEHLPARADLPTDLEDPATLELANRLLTQGTAPNGGPSELERFIQTLEGRLDGLSQDEQRALARAAIPEESRNWLKLYAKGHLQVSAAWRPRPLDHRPYDPPARVQPGQATRYQGTLSEALTTFRRVLEISPGNTPAVLKQMSIYRALGRRDLMKRAYERLQDLREGHYGSLVQLFRLRQDLPERGPGEAVRFARQVATRFPHHTRLLDLLVTAHLYACNAATGFHKDPTRYHRHDDCLAETDRQVDLQWALERLAAVRPHHGMFLHQVLTPMEHHEGHGGRSVLEWSRIYADLQIPVAKLRHAERLFKNVRSRTEVREACAVLLEAHYLEPPRPVLDVGSCLETGDVALEDGADARDFYQPLAEAGNLRAMRRLGMMSLRAPETAPLGARWLQRAARDGDRISAFQLAVHEMLRGEGAAALSLFQKIANDPPEVYRSGELGIDRYAAAMVGYLTEHGPTGELESGSLRERESEADRWYRQARMGVPEALEEFARVTYEEGSPLHVRGLDALPALRLAASLGSGLAARTLAAFHTGLLLQPPYDKAAVERGLGDLEDLPSRSGLHGLPTDWSLVARWGERALLLETSKEGRAASFALTSIAQRRGRLEWSRPEDRVAWLANATTRLPGEVRAKLLERVALGFHRGIVGFPRDPGRAERFRQEAFSLGSSLGPSFEPLEESTGPVRVPLAGYEHLGVPVYQVSGGGYMVGGLHYDDLEDIPNILVQEARRRERGRKLSQDLDGLRGTGSAEQLREAALALRDRDTFDDIAGNDSGRAGLDESRRRRETVEDLLLLACERGDGDACWETASGALPKNASTRDEFLQRRRILWMGAASGHSMCTYHLAMSYSPDPRFDADPDAKTDPDKEIRDIWLRAAFQQNPKGLAGSMIRRLRLDPSNPFPGGIPPAPSDVSAAAWGTAEGGGGARPFDWTTFGMGALALALLTAGVRRLGS